MRVFRTILGMLSLTTGLPALLAGGGLWAVMQHRDPGGAFSGELQRLTVPGYAVIVPDIDRLLRDDAPFARIGDTQLRLSAVTVEGRSFLGLAPSDEVARYLAGVPRSQIDAVDLGTGALPLTTTRTGGRGAPAGPPTQQDFWTVSGIGQISLTPGELDDRPYSLVLMNADGGPMVRLAAIAEIRPGWLNPSTWGLLTLGTLLVMLGVTVLLWPGRRREVVYVVEPSQVPELMHAIGAPLPLPGGAGYFAGGRAGGAHRSRTLAEPRPTPPALPQFAWPPRAPEPASSRPVPLNAATLTTPFPGDAPYADVTPAPAGLVASPADHDHTAVPVSGSLPTSGPTGSASGVTAASRAGSAAGPAGAHTPAPGQPLSLFGQAPAVAGLQPGPVGSRRGERRPATADLPQFQATAVGAWVAATAPERARQTEARAAARLAEAARRNAGKFAPVQPGQRNASANARIPVATPRRDNGETPATPRSAAPRRDDMLRPATAPGPARPETLEDTEGQRPSAAGDPATAATGMGTGSAAGTGHDDTPGKPAFSRTTPAGSRIALCTGPAATDWIATGTTDIGAAPARRPGPRRSTAPAAPQSADPDPAAPQSADPDPVTAPDRTEAAEPTSGTASTAPAAAPAAEAPSSHDPRIPNPVSEATSPPPQWPLIGEPARGRGPASPRPENRQADSSTTDDTDTVRHVRPRASMHAAEAAEPVPVAPENNAETATPGAPAADRGAPAPESAAAAREVSPAVGPRPPAARPEPARPHTQRRSVHAVEAEGPGALPKQPAPIPTRGSVAADGMPTGTKVPGTAAPAPAGRSKPEPAAPASTGREESEAAAEKALAKERPGPGLKAAATGTPAPAQTDTTGPATAVAKAGGGTRRPSARKAGDDQLLARAQDRATGKPTASRPVPAGRRVPAAWIKAAESVAARTGQAGDGPAPIMPANVVPEKAVREKVAPANEVPAKVVAEKVAPANVVPEKAAPEKVAPANEVPQKDMAAGVVPAKVLPEKSGSTGEPDSTAVKTRGPARPLDYREEAAELLGSGERRRRRTVAGRNSPKSDRGETDTVR